MPSHGPPSPSTQPAKRQRQSSFDNTSPRDDQTSPSEHQSDAATAAATAITTITGPGGAKSTAAAAAAGQSSNFRNVSACNRCRLRKNRCDQRLPSCASCAKAGVACVGYDPITKKEIPRSYVFYLETRVEQLESLLTTNNITFPPADNLELCSRPTADSSSTGKGPDRDYTSAPNNDAADKTFAKPPRGGQLTAGSLNPKKAEESPALLNIVSSPSKPRSLASASGVSFARVVFAAVQYSVSDQSGGGGGGSDRANSRQVSGAGTSMRDSFFGLHTKPTIQPATFPDREVGLRLITLYFEHANPQIPILHRGEFMYMFEQAYTNPSTARGSRELYMLNMVFAIGCGVIVGEPVKGEASGANKMSSDQSKGQCQPEEYHASAIVHLESCLSTSGGGLEVLQAVLLLANFALLRPVPPGLWYIIGVAVRLAVDLGLHYEDGMDVEAVPDLPERDPADNNARQREGSGQERGRRLWVRDMRRRLWWCTYSFDRLVSTCVGRPFGISDQVITTDLPSLLDDDYITPGGFLQPSADEMQPSYKLVAHHYFRLRMLQSEILQVLQYNQSQFVRSGASGATYPEMHTYLASPFLVQFDSFRSWRHHIDERLLKWKMSAPTREETGVAFSTEFLELNYWQAIIMLYRQSLSVPAMFEGEYNTSNEVDSPRGYTTTELREDEDRIYLKVAEAGQKILRIYRQLHLSGLVSYTYLSTHHLFMAGISYLYAIWHSSTVRSRLTMDEVDFTVLAAKSVFTDMIDKCPPAETCRDAFDRTARATIKMASSKGGFGPQSQPVRRRGTNTMNRTPKSDTTPTRHRNHQDAQPFQFDLSLSDTISSPTLSVTNDMGSRGSPSMSSTKAFEADYGISSRSPVDQGMKQEPPGPSNGPMRMNSASRVGGTSNGSNSANNNSFMGQQFGLQGSMDYPDTQTMDFLQNLGATSNGDFGPVDPQQQQQQQQQQQLDLGFGMNWEGLPNDYGEGQQMNPFDTFFFGGQQGNGGGGGGMNM